MSLTNVSYPCRVATIIRATGEVASISQLQGPPDPIDRHKAAFYDREVVPAWVRPGMVRQSNTYDWPKEHADAPRSVTDIRRYDAERGAA